MTNDVVILDTETTGTNDGLALDEPVSISVTNPYGGLIFHTLIKPTTPISDETAAIHGITNAMVADAPSFVEVLPRLMAVIDGKTLAIWNASFDVRLLITAAHIHQVVMPRLTYRCVMTEYAKAFGHPHEKRADDFKWWRLTAAYEHQFPMTDDALKLLSGAHDATTDCVMTAQLMRLMEVHGLNARYTDKFDVVLRRAQYMKTAKGGGYLRFYTAGGQQVNVFDGGFKKFSDADYAITGLLNALSKRGTDCVHSLHKPISAVMVYKQYPEISQVLGVEDGQVQA